MSSAPDPTVEHLLPTNDKGWNEGKIGSNEALLTQYFSPKTALGPFARTCQAVHMLCKVLRHVQGRRSTTDITEALQEAMQLNNALIALDASINAAQDVSSDSEADTSQSFTSMALCTSARFLLYNDYACNEPDDHQLQSRLALEAEAQSVFLAGIKALASTSVPKLAQRIRKRGAAGLSNNPILASCLYHAATECAWFIKEDDDAEMYLSLGHILAALQVIHSEWQVAGRLALRSSCAIQYLLMLCFQRNI